MTPKHSSPALPKEISDLLLELCAEIQACDDRIGRYSDHEGTEEGPTYHLYQLGFATFKSHCIRAIEDHEAAIIVFKKLLKLNRTRE